MILKEKSGNCSWGCIAFIVGPASDTNIFSIHDTQATREVYLRVTDCKPKIPSPALMALVLHIYDGRVKMNYD